MRFVVESELNPRPIFDGKPLNGTMSIEISTDPSRLDVSLIHDFLSNSYWATGRPREVERSIKHSLCFGAYENGSQLAFARLVTDRSVFAYLADVFVVPDHRGRGISRLLLDAILAHPDLKDVRLFRLATRDAHGLYAKYGFKSMVNCAISRRLAHHGTLLLFVSPRTDELCEFGTLWLRR